MLSFKRSTIAILSLTVLMPAAVFAANIDRLLPAADDATVSRGDFLRAAVEMLHLPTDDVTPIEGQRVPSALVPVVNAAEGRGAMSAFRGRYQLARGITRGEAIVVLQSLLRLTPTGDRSSVDTPDAEPLHSAVAVALENGWVELQDDGTIGLNDVLKGREARLLLRKANGEGGVTIESPSDTDLVVIPRTSVKSRSLPEEEMLKTVWQILLNHYVDEEKVDPKEAAYRAAEAIVGSVNDPYTTFMRPIEASDFNAQLEGAVSGIGAQVEQRDGMIVIIAPLDGSPAAQAGLQAGDMIIAVDGTNLEGLGFLEAIGKIRGPEGTTANLTIRRGETEFEVKVRRQILSVPEIVTSWQGTVAVVKLVQFGDVTARDFRRTVSDLMEKNPTGFILDLRNNPGGYLDSASVVLSAFLPEDSTVVFVDSRSEETEEVTVGEPIVPDDLKVIVLVNKGSASASEIVAGALQDDKRATVIGEQSFGKGTVQNLIPLSDGSNLKVTTARWLTPKKHTIQDVGVTPDIVVESSTSRDEQMLRALELLR